MMKTWKTKKGEFAGDIDEQIQDFLDEYAFDADNKKWECKGYNITIIVNKRDGGK